MNINRHNYESFFLLYADNELSVQERNAVDIFVQENTDLQEELELLQQSILEPEDCIFKGKNNLFRKEEITPAIEEKILLYIDQELDELESKKLLSTVAADAGISTALSLLQQTKLLPDTNIIFERKDLLYRKEKGRIIAIKWWKMAAAAAFVGFVIWGTVTYSGGGDKLSSKDMATNKPVKKGNSPDEVADQSPIIEKESGKKIVMPQDKTMAMEQQKETTKKVVQEARVGSATKQNRPSPPVVSELASKQKIVAKPSNNLPKPYFENNDKNMVNEAEVIVAQQQNSALAGTLPQTAQKSNIYTASFSDNSNENKEDLFILSDEEPKKSKLSGFLRKAKRVLERNTKSKNGDDEIKIANLSFTN